MKLKILDRYIIGKFLGTFVFAMMLIIVIVIIFDVSERIDDFIEKKAPLQAIFLEYYLNFIPYFINLFSPLFTFIAVIFFTAKMASNTEIVAILSGGVSFRRLLLPYFIAASLIAVTSYLLSSWVIPPANKVRLAFENVYANSPYRYTARNIHRKIAPDTYIYLESYNNIDQIGHKFSMEKISNGVLTYKLMSDYIRWDSLKTRWLIHNYYYRKIDGMKESLKSGVVFDTVLAFTPEQFNRRINNIETMNNRELNDFIEEETARGSEVVNYYLIEKYRRSSAPVAILILTLIGVALASKKVRGGIGAQIGTGLGLSFTYILFMQVSTTFAVKANFSPFISVWIPNFIFAAIGILLMRQRQNS
jgi:lipopolysaccharide export system permease protein